MRVSALLLTWYLLKFGTVVRYAGFRRELGSLKIDATCFMLQPLADINGPLLDFVTLIYY